MYYKMRYVPDQHPAKVPHRTGNTVKQQKPRSSQTRAFDPDELTKRLYIVLAEQKAHAERKKRTKAKIATKDSAARPTTQDTQKCAGPSGLPEKATAPALKKSRSILRPRIKTRSGHVLDEKETDKLNRINSKTSTGSSDKGQDDENIPTYHHVPQVAADQFSRTTTVDMPTDKNLIHKLSRKAMKFHMEGPHASRGLSMAANADAAPFEQHKALQRAQSMRERQYERNQFQHTPTLAPTVEVDEGRRARHKHHRHSLQHQTMEVQFRATLAAQKTKSDGRRMSTGSMLAGPNLDKAIEEQESFVVLSDKPESCELCDAFPVNIDEHRVDWTQSDELTTLPKQITPPPQLRKSDSRWTFRGRLGSFTKHGKDEKTSSPPDDKETLGDSPKSPKSGFFARFKR